VNAFAEDDRRRLKPLVDRWTDVFKRDTVIHLSLIGAITAATFQGYLKDRIGGPVPYALADLAFLAAVFIWFAGLAIRRMPISGPGRLPHLVLVLILLPTFYLLHPGTPLVIEIAGLRAWAAYPIGTLIALTVIRNVGQARAYIGVVLVLCFITAIYGIMQYLEGPDAALDTALGSLRHGSSVYYDITGTSRSEFRAFSTFTFPAPFAGMMVFGMLLATGIALGSGCRRRTRLGMALLIPLFFAGMTASGTRAALVTLLVGLLVLGWYRGLRPGQFLLIPVMIGAFHIATLLTAGRVTERFTSIITSENILWLRAYAPITIAGRALGESPFGIGLGRTGIGVPFSMFQAQPPGFFIGSDGDIGRAAVEMGVFGILLIVFIVFAIIPKASQAVRYLKAGPNDDVALGIGAVIVSTSLIIFIGSPLSTAPHGMIWWIFLGIVLKLANLKEQQEEDFQTVPIKTVEDD